MSSYHTYGVAGGGSPFWADAVATFTALPVTGLAGEAILVKDTGVVYYWTGTAWAPISASPTSTGNLTESTSSVLTITGGTGALLHNASIRVKLSGPSQAGYLSAGDWNIFKNKEPAISPKNTAFNKNYGTTPTDVKVNGVQAVGVIDEIARIDHVHPTDTSRQVAGSYEVTTNKGVAGGYASLDANTLVPITQIPPAALERLVIVADQAARYALTTATVQNGDTVKQTDINEMFFVKDDTQLNNAAGYAVYSAGTASSVAWSGVTTTPTTLAGYGILDAVKSVTNLEWGTVDPYARTQIWNHATNATLRLGSLAGDGDPTTSSAEGIVVYGQNAAGAPMTADDFAYARIKPLRIGIYNSTLAGYAGYIFRVDNTEMYFAKDDGTVTFKVNRVTGEIEFAPTTPTDWATAPTGIKQALNAVALASNTASSTKTGVLTSTDWSTFNGKEPAVTKGNLSAASAKITIGGTGTGALIGTGATVDLGAVALDDLSDVVTTTPSTGQSLVFNGVDWVNQTVVVAAVGPGNSVYLDDTAIVANASNTNTIYTLSPTPITTTPEDTDTIATGTTLNTAIRGETYMYDTSLGKTSIPAGIWNFNYYCSVSSATNVTQLLINVHRVMTGAGTVTTTGTGTTRTATITGGTPFIAGDAAAAQDGGSYLQTPAGIFQISAFTSSSVVTLTVPLAYVNESAVVYRNHRKLFQAPSGAITTTTINLKTWSVTQPSFALDLTDTISYITFGINSTNTNRTITFTHNGTLRYSNSQTPLVTNHNDLPGLQGGAANELYHLTASEYSKLEVTDIEAKSANFSALNRKSYLVDSSTLAISVQLPTPVLNARITIKDFGFNAHVNAITLLRAGTEKIEGIAASYIIDSDGASVRLISNGTDWAII